MALRALGVSGKGSAGHYVILADRFVLQGLNPGNCIARLCGIVSRKGFYINIDMKGVYMFFADGFEETEALTTVDMLRRGGVDVRMVSITDSGSAMSSHKIHIMTDMNFSEFMASVQLDGTTDKDFMIFPGGMPGSANLAGKKELMELMLKHYAEGGSVAAICAAPSVVLSLLPGIDGKTMTCYDGFEQALTDKGVNHTRDGVAKDGRIITGRGAGHTVAFGLEILAHIKDRATADTVARSIML